MFSHLSPKRANNEIGRFGLGFKSVLGVTDTPEFFSRSGSFRFDRVKAKETVQPIAPYVQRYPVLRLAQAVDPWPEAQTDAILKELMGWAVNIVRLRLKLGAHGNLAQQISDFPAEFLLFVEHVSELVVQDDEQEVVRNFSLRRDGDQHVLDDGESTTHWVLTKRLHSLSADARSDSRSLDDPSEVPIWWAAPIDQLNDPGGFWAFFPTSTNSLLSGILNAPWKTNEDRQNLLPGVYNDELIDAAAALVADVLPRLSTTDDPAQHLDALPRRQEAGDSAHSNRLRDQLHSNLRGRAFTPDQNGKMRELQEIRYPPQGAPTHGTREIPEEALERWAAFSGRPSDWLHHSALTRNRLARLDQLYRVEIPLSDRRYISSVLPRATVAEWLEALVQGAKSERRPLDDWLDASMAAIQTAALMPSHIRRQGDLGEIVLTANGQWVKPDRDSVWLAKESVSDKTTVVHPELEADRRTLRALKELGLTPASSEALFRNVALALLGNRAGSSDQREYPDDWRKFWTIARDISHETAARIIRSNESWKDALRVRTMAGNWRSLYKTLLPGHIVPADRSRDRNVTIDIEAHESDLRLLLALGAVDTAREGQKLSDQRKMEFVRRNRWAFTQRDLPRSPHRDRLNFPSGTTTAGPLDVLENMSDEGRARFTWALLELDETFQPWIMRHDTQDIYPPLVCQSPALEALRRHGRISTEIGIWPLAEGLGERPKNPAVRYALLAHPQADFIREEFGLTTDFKRPEEPVGADAPIPLIDVWPGLAPYLSNAQMELELVSCDGFRRFGRILSDGDLRCMIKGDLVYVTRQVEEGDELRAVLLEIDLEGVTRRIDEILRFRTPADIRKARDEVKKHTTDEERLLAAVGESELRRLLPRGLIAILEQTRGPIRGVPVARAAIATFHTDALREYRRALDHLDPPRQWAGSTKTVEFVRSLGFDEEWAGERNTRRPPYIEVEGPSFLPKLHGYQRRIVGNVRELLQSNGAMGKRRGMLSMPTGSGKTRVAVQAIVEAIREDSFNGGIIWVADRDELCEQAVESWREVWASEGSRAKQLRISRMWAGQPRPRPTGDMHVVVASIQTLSAKMSRQPESYDFLGEFKLIVFDEAHRSVSPAYTSVMGELGLTRSKSRHDPFLIGLTATPYRGHDDRETRRLVNRYSRNRLDSGAFRSEDPEEVIQELQEMRVLAHAYHEIIEGGVFSLTPDELRQSLGTPWLPRSAEDRIAEDIQRTQRIVDAYMEHVHSVDPEWPTLIFATSVEHSQTVAALLTANGIKARAVSSNTETMSRRRLVEEFRAGEIKALVNYAIFREGFDAPKTRAIIVARPVYSPNLYFQMIGRGLRGVKNGGNERCLILNVRDNIENFEGRLAFTELDWLWAGGRGSAPLSW